MRARDHVDHAEQEDEQQRDQRNRRAHALLQEIVDEREGRGHRYGRKHDHSAPAAEFEGAVIGELRQPFLGQPRMARERVREFVDPRNGLVRPDPAADRDVPLAVGIEQEAVGVLQRHQQERHQRREEDYQRMRTQQVACPDRARSGRDAAHPAARSVGLSEPARVDTGASEKPTARPTT